jgi:hypothetical protein
MPGSGSNRKSKRRGRGVVRNAIEEALATGIRIYGPFAVGVLLIGMAGVIVGAAGTALWGLPVSVGWVLGTGGGGAAAMWRARRAVEAPPAQLPGPEGGNAPVDRLWVSEAAGAE